MESKAGRTILSDTFTRRILTPDVGTKLRWIIAAAPCLVLIVMITFGALEYRRMMLENAVAEAADRIDSLASRVHEFFDRAIVLTRSIVSRQKAVGAHPASDTRAFLASLLDDIPAYEAQGLYIAFAERPHEDSEAVQWVWRRLVPGSKGYEIRTTDKLTYDYHVKSDRSEWYHGAKAKNDGDFYITRPYFDKDDTNVWMVSVTRPIYVREGDGLRFIGVAGVDLKLDDLTAYLQATMGETLGEESRDEGGYFYLFSNVGMAYGLPARIRRALGGPPREAFRVDELRRTFPEIDSVYARSESSLIRFTTPHGGSRLVSWKRISRDFDDKVVLSLPAAVVYGPAFRATVLSIGIGLVALAVMIGVVTTIADYYLSRPIRRLNAAAEAVESGNYGPVELGKLADRRDEFGQLARGFRQMVKEVAAREQELRDAQKHLDHRVRLRTAELEHTLEELRAAKEAAERATKQMEEFSTGVAHDMRNLLMIIIGYGEDLLRRAVKKKIDAFIPDLKLIANKGNELIELLNDLLWHSKAMSGKDVTLDLDEFDVADLIKSRMEGIELIAQKNGNTVTFRADNDLGRMVADKVKVSRILMNLLTNACKFTHNGTVTLTVWRERVESGDWVLFQIADTGIGMSAEQVAKLFDRYSQVHPQSGHNRMGFGLGLANSLLYCEAMGGAITVESEVGQGATFTVRLPAVVQVAESPSAAGAAPAVAQPADVAHTSAANLILVIDDDASISELLRRNLGDEGFQTLAAYNGEEGLRLAKRALPSAIILDVVLPGMDGWGVLAALKTDPRTSRIPVIMASILDERERGMQMGALAYVTKPFSRERLAGILHKHFGDRPGGRIVLVSEHPDVRARLQGPIVNLGWEIVTAEDGNAALGLLRSSKPDLILLDLPPNSGRGSDFIDRVRNNPDWDSIPIVVMSAAELSPGDRRELQGKLERMLRKGLYNREELLHEISVLVDEHRQHSKSLTKEESHA
jgi:signal transduction histidine kinase/DNA-binding response OmpR family regulator